MTSLGQLNSVEARETMMIEAAGVEELEGQREDDSRSHMGEAASNRKCVLYGVYISSSGLHTLLFVLSPRCPDIM